MHDAACTRAPTLHACMHAYRQAAIVPHCASPTYTTTNHNIKTVVTVVDTTRACISTHAPMSHEKRLISPSHAPPNLTTTHHIPHDTKNTQKHTSTQRTNPEPKTSRADVAQLGRSDPIRTTARAYSHLTTNTCSARV